MRLFYFNYCRSFYVKLTFFTVFVLHYQLILLLAGVFVFLQVTLPLNKLPTSGLWFWLSRRETACWMHVAFSRRHNCPYWYM